MEQRNCLFDNEAVCANGTTPPSTDEECESLISGSSYSLCGPESIRFCSGLTVPVLQLNKTNP